VALSYAHDVGNFMDIEVTVGAELDPVAPATFSSRTAALPTCFRRGRCDPCSRWSDGAMKRGISSVAVTAMLLALAGCDAGPQTLGWEGSTASEPKPLPWFGGPQYYAQWPHGFPTDPAFFPIGVWMQNPLNAARYQAVGINHYVGLWQGPTDEQFTTWLAAGMHVVCEQAGVWQSSPR